MIFFRLTADADQFLTIAKFRALRRLWGRVEDACGLAAAPVFISAETAWRMMTRRDPYVNMLRATIAVFSAGVGGADAITVLPFTLARGLPDRFARRIARNTQLVLPAESHLAKVGDAAAGSGVHRGFDRPALPLRLDVVSGDRKRRRRGGRAGAGPDPEESRAGARARGKPPWRGAPTCSPAPAILPISTSPRSRCSTSPRWRRRRRPPASPSSRCGASAWPSRSSSCAMLPTGCWRRPGRARKSSSPIWVCRPISRRARTSPGISSRPAASRR